MDQSIKHRDPQRTARDKIVKTYIHVGSRFIKLPKCCEPDIVNFTWVSKPLTSIFTAKKSEVKIHGIIKNQVEGEVEEAISSLVIKNIVGNIICTIVREINIAHIFQQRKLM